MLLGSRAFGQLEGGDAASALRLTTTLEKVVEETGADGAVRYTLSSDLSRAPGDQFILTVRFANVSGVTTDDVRITTAVPDGMGYVADSATGPGGLVLFSTDGGRTFGTPQELAARTAGGSAAQPAPYTHVRWVLEAPLEPGATGFVRLRLAQG
jgi:uncharacterized repeat protein (TIGR01451 family)